MTDILHRVGIRSSAGKMFEMLSQENGFADWWTQNVTASPEVGAIDQFRFGDRGYNAMKVLELSPGRCVRGQCTDGARGWIGTELTFDLREGNGVTVVLFAQRGWKEQSEFMHYCSTIWGTYLLSLKSLCEMGKGTPYPEDVDIG